MFLPTRLLYIAAFQVILMSIATYFFVTSEYRTLSSQSLQAIDHFLIEQKKQELKNYTSLAVSAVEELYHVKEPNIKEAQIKVAKVLNNMLYNGDDGYFFVYDGEGNSIAHPKEPFRIGKNWWNLENKKGEKTIQILISNAKSGGGFYRYPWFKPSKNQMSEKMGYSVYLKKWNWMIGTGVYLDDVNKQLNKLQNEIDQHINKTKQIILMVAISSIFLIFLLGQLVNISQKKKTDIKINKLNQKIITLQEEEHRYISRELHDGIIQILVSIKYSIEATGIHLSKANIEKPKPLIHAETNLVVAIQEVRRISHHLHPKILDELGLSAALAELSAEFTERTGIAVKVTKPSVRKLLPDYINTTLYRVVQESLINIQKHADATQISIDLSINDKWLLLEIKDNGDGFDMLSYKKKNSPGIGLRNIAERIEYHSGQFEVLSSSKGTCVKVKIPKTSFVNHANKSTIEEV